MIIESYFKVRYVETDAMGVMHHASYLSWLEVGRADFMEKTSISYKELEGMGFFLMITDIKIKYKKALKYDDKATLYTKIKVLKSRTIEFEYQVINENKDICILAETSHILTDKNYVPKSFPRLIIDSVKDINL